MTPRVRILLAEAADHDAESCRLQMEALLEMGDSANAALFSRGARLARERAAYWRAHVKAPPHTYVDPFELPPMVHSV